MTVSKDEVLEHFKPPFRYDRNATMIFDANKNLVLDVRNYGHLSEALQDEDKVVELQDAFGELTVKTLNEAFTKKLANIDQAREVLQRGLTLANGYVSNEAVHEVKAYVKRALELLEGEKT